MALSKSSAYAAVTEDTSRRIELIADSHIVREQVIELTIPNVSPDVDTVRIVLRSANPRYRGKSMTVPASFFTNTDF